MQPTPTVPDLGSRGWILLWLLVALTGVLALISPLAAGLALTVILAWALLLAGAVHLWLTFEPHRGGSRGWHLLCALAYLVAGGYLLWQPGLGLASLTVLLAAMLVAGGAFRLVAHARLRGLPGAGWLAWDGILSLILAALILLTWPLSSAWAIGVLIGVNLLFTGVSGLMFSLLVRRHFRA